MKKMKTALNRRREVQPKAEKRVGMRVRNVWARFFMANAPIADSGEELMILYNEAGGAGQTEKLTAPKRGTRETGRKSPSGRTNHRVQEKYGIT